MVVDLDAASWFRGLTSVHEHTSCMKLFTRNVLFATLGFSVLNAGKATFVGFPPPTGAEAVSPYYPTLLLLSLAYAWVFKYVWLKLDDQFEEGEQYVGREWE